MYSLAYTLWTVALGLAKRVSESFLLLEDGNSYLLNEDGTISLLE